MKDSFFTIDKPSRGLYKDKGSKFISFAFPVTSEEEISGVLQSLHREYHDARHHCYAWKLGFTDNIYRINDNGEPAGTAGKPILGQIKSKQLTNILVVVVRYFGGILLGTGGLTRAYKEATIDALENAKIIKEYIYDCFRLTFDYPSLSQVIKIIEDCHGIIVKRDFQERCEMEVNIRNSFAERFSESMRRLEQTNFERISN